MNDVDMIAGVDADPDRHAEDPVIRQRLRPHRIDLEARRHRLAVGLRLSRSFQQVLADAEPDHQRDDCAADQHVPDVAPHVTLPSGLRAPVYNFRNVLRANCGFARKVGQGYPPPPRLRRGRAEARRECSRRAQADVAGSEGRTGVPYRAYRAKFGAAATIVATLLLLRPAVPAAHDIPNDVTIQAFVKPEGRTLR